MKETFVCFCVVFFGFISASDTIKVNCTKSVIMGKYGSSVVLPCWLTPETNAETLEIRWYRPTQFQNPALMYQNHKTFTDLNEMYINRSSLTTRNSQSTGLKQGDVSLRLDNLVLSDTGTFHCYVSGDTSYDGSTVELSLTALGSFPRLSLEHRHDSVNLSCSSCGWFPVPHLLWKSTNEKGDALFNPQSPIYSKQENGLFCIYSWVILTSSVSNKVSCSVSLSEDEKRNVSLDLGAQQSVRGDNTGVWKLLFTLALLCLLALIGFFLYRKYKPGYKAISTDEPPKDHTPTNIEDLRAAAVTITLNKENCKKEYLKFSLQGDLVRDVDEAADEYKGRGFPYELCVYGSNKLSSSRAYWEVELKPANVPRKKSWLIGVAKASNTISDKKSDLTPSNGFWFLCSDPENGLYVNTEPGISFPVNITPERVGVLLDSQKSELAFYNATDGVHIFTMRAEFPKNIVPLFNPGIGDKAPLKIINPQVKTENEPGGNANA